MPCRSGTRFERYATSCGGKRRVACKELLHVNGPGEVILGARKGGERATLRQSLPRTWVGGVRQRGSGKADSKGNGKERNSSSVHIASKLLR